jgi:SAM-dependent methyltransferase
MFSKYLYIMKHTFLKKSLNRIFQQLYSKNRTISGEILEFGTNKNSSKKFTKQFNISTNSKIFYADNYILNDKNFFKENLESKLSFSQNKFDNILIFNVLEHVYDFNNAVKEINRCLKKDGKIIGSTPFFHRVHNAPGDYSRFTKQYITRSLEINNFQCEEIINYGFGPFTAAYTVIFDVTKKIPFLNNILLSIFMLLDLIISKFTNSDLKDIYPITICFRAKKKYY